MNELEKALIDQTNMALDIYLDITPTAQVRQDIENIRKKAALSTEAGRLRERVMAALEKDDE